MSSTESTELCRDIVATASILIKFEMCHIMDSQSSFVEFLNAAGFRTVRGKEFSKMSFRKMWERLSPSEIKDILSEFDSRNFDILSTMVER
ncbi:anti-sigma factor [Cronobacter phage S13]|jgi:hypothetical protein|uniref:Anti-sigma 70 protein n=1 Tax=Cronobacter phage LPCS28 TaxID=2924885 RepID=A0AAE9K662_9CAUD|nr:anti-sigma factor [Cronobacter phage S13]YP_010665855.1 anti-sigma factor [Cronobacter phage LPCS28]AIA64803.1 putative anti-sigma 70 protein [Cronobacter phage S13]UNY47044.1 hypothetical protein EHEKIMEA_00162 [Cronobacter phage LPCS28]